MAITHTIALTLQDGTEIDVFDEYTVKIGMFDHGNPFTLSLFHSNEARAAWNYLINNVKCYDPVTLTIDGALQLSGVIGTVHPYADSKSTRLEIAGRDMVGLAMDADVSPRLSAKGSTLAEVLEELFVPLGIKVVVAASASEVRDAQLGKRRGGRPKTHSRTHQIDKFHPPVGERIWAAAQRLCMRYGYLMWSAPYDADTIAVIIDVPAYDSEPLFQLTRRERREDNDTQDSNILAGGLRVCTDGIPTETRVYGAGSRGDANPSRVLAHQTNDRLDPRFVRHPPRYIPRHQRTNQSRGLGQAEQQARRSVNDQMRAHRVYECVVQGHSQPYQGDPDLRLIYAINSMARVRDDIFEIDESMLLDSVTFSGSASGNAGTTTRLSLHTKGAVVCEPDAETAPSAPRGPRKPSEADFLRYRSLAYAQANDNT